MGRGVAVSCPPHPSGLDALLNRFEPDAGSAVVRIRTTAHEQALDLGAVEAVDRKQRAAIGRQMNLDPRIEPAGVSA